jgi:hypothetical protein
VPFINDLPKGLLSAANFVQGLGGAAKRIVWDLNVFVFNATEACDQIRWVSQTAQGPMWVPRGSHVGHIACVTFPAAPCHGPVGYFLTVDTFETQSHERVCVVGVVPLNNT